MAQFVHIFDSRDRAKIERGGVRISKGAPGVFATPVLQDHTITHQWMRELRRFNKVPMMAVQFRIPDQERVTIGRFNQEAIDTTAAGAIGIAMDHDAPFGLEVIVPRAISKMEIMRFYTPPKTVGWRYWPESHGNQPCPCKYCQRGQPYSRAIRDRDELA